MTTPIPQPPAIPLLGNVMDIDPRNSLLSLMHLAEKYGPIYKLNMLGNMRYFVSSVELVDELCDEKRFCKSVSGPLEELRAGIGAGLFTAYHGEHAWEVAHRTLVPAFGPIGIKDMFDEMHDIASQLVSKWARNQGESIDVPDNYTRLTLDSIALCAMGKRFNSFYTKEMHPFVDAMVDFLLEGGRRNRRSRLEALLNPSYERKYRQDIDLMKSVAEEVIAERRANPVDKKDLLNAVLFGKDPKTGEKLSDENMMDNLITFLIAGHETTSGLLSFTTYYLIKNTDAMQRAQEEVDRVIGKGPVTYQHMSKLPYIEACLREALRLWPTAAVFSIKPIPGSQSPIIIGGQYELPPDAAVAVLLPQAGRDSEVFGADVEEFRPERMFGENFARLPPNAWKPFGNGARGCIGRPFAWQEAVLTLAMVLQNFNLRLDDPAYQLQIKQTLTIKPDNFFMKATLRDGIDSIGLEKRLYGGVADIRPSKNSLQAGLPTDDSTSLKPMTVLYGSNSGTCEGLAQSLASDARRHGFNALVQPLDAAVDRFPTDQPVTIVTASYEGNPPDNASAFTQWLQKVDANKVKGAQIAVFGCGHKDWVATYQKVPTFIETELLRKGATATLERGETNVADGTIFDDFDAWADDLWSKLSSEPSEEADIEGLEMELSTSARATHLHHSVQDAIVLKNEILTKPDVPEKRHMEFQLPTSMTYEAGDYLALLPVNNVTTISRVLRRFGLPWDAMMKLNKDTHTTIPTEKELAVSAVLGAYVELNSPATRKNLALLSKFAGYEITDSGSLLSILERHPKITLPFSVYLSMLTPMRLRTYSISSSPLANPSIASVTFSVLSSSSPDDAHLGVATNYLASLVPGSTVQLSVKKSPPGFHLPRDDSSTPLILVGAGTGLAPFRGFVQERAAKIAAGKKLAEALLFIGCRDPDQDKLYTSELEAWEAAGAVKVFYAFSRQPKASAGCKYVQDRVYEQREPVIRLFKEDARVYVCGSSRVGRGLADVAARFHIEGRKEEGQEVTQEQATQWWEGLRGERYTVDVFD